MPRKAFLKKKSLLDRFKDDYATHTGYIQSARAKHTWNNPLTRRKRTKELNKWIKSFAGKDHIHKLARFNAQQAGKNEDASSNVSIAYHISPTKFEKFRLMPKSGMGTTFYGRGIYLTYDKSVIDYYKNLLADYYDNLYIYTVIISPKAKIISEDEIFDYIDDSVDLEDSEQVANLLKNKVDGIRYYNDEDGNSVVIFNDDLVSIKSRQDCSMKNEAMSLKGFLENLTEKLTKQFDLDLEEVQAYLNSHTQEMQELLDDKELSLKEKVLFVRSEITGEKDEAKKSKRLFNKRKMERIALSEGSKVSPYLVEIAHKILTDEYGWKASTIEEVADWLGDHKQAFEHAYGQALRSSDDDKANVKAGIEAALDEEERGVMNAEIAMMGESKKSEFYMDGDDSEDYYYCHRCGRVTPSYELDAHGGFCSDCDARWTAEHENESKDTDEKLGYEKGHKNSKGEDAPWVIRSHEDNRVLASFANEDDAKEHLKRMKQYSKTESKVNEEAEIKDKQYYLDMFDKAYKECVQLDIDDGGDGQNWANYFATGDEDPTTFSQKEADEIVGYYMEFHPNWEGETDRPYKDWMENIDNSPKTALDKEITRILKALYAPNESKQSEALETYACFIDFATEDDAKKGMEIVKGWHPFRNDTAVLIDSLGEDAANRLWNDWKQKCAKAGLAISDAGEVYKEEPTCFYGNESKQSESKNLSGYTSDIISKLDGMWACGLNGAKRLAEKYADVIQQNYTDGDLSTAETAKFIAGQENLTESRKKTESKQSEGHLELIDTIIVPKWLWEAHTFGNEYGEDLDEHEQEILAKFEEEYGKQYYLDDRSEEADFRSRNDFDEYGGPCYEVDVYKMS